MSNSPEKKGDVRFQQLPWAVAGIAVVLAIVELFIIMRGMNPESVDLNITDPSGKAAVKLQVKAQQVSYDAILDTIFSKPDSVIAFGVNEWIREKKHMYPLDDERLASALASDLCDPIPESPIEEHLRKAQECADKPTASRLRELAENHLRPFHYIGIQARLGIPEAPEDRPARGRASVCRELGLLGKHLEVVVGERSIQVEASGSYACTGFTTFPDIQLSLEDAVKLFSRPINKLEQVVVVPIS